MITSAFKTLQLPASSAALAGVQARGDQCRRPSAARKQREDLGLAAYLDQGGLVQEGPLMVIPWRAGCHTLRPHAASGCLRTLQRAECLGCLVRPAALTIHAMVAAIAAVDAPAHPSSSPGIHASGWRSNAILERS